jgi:hypothetical protein
LEVKKSAKETMRRKSSSYTVYSVEFGKLFPTLIKKENKIFLIFKEIQKGAVAKSYMKKGLRNI